MKPLCLCAICGILVFVISLSCFAELTENDVRQIRQIIREEIEPVKKEIESIKIEIATIKGDIKALEGKMATKDDLLSIWKDITGKMDTLYGLIIGVLIAIIVSVILPPVFQKWLERRKVGSDEERFQRIEAKLEKLEAILLLKHEG